MYLWQTFYHPDATPYIINTCYQVMVASYVYDNHQCKYTRFLIVTVALGTIWHAGALDLLLYHGFMLWKQCYLRIRSIGTTSLGQTFHGKRYGRSDMHSQSKGQWGYSTTSWVFG